MKSVYVLIPCVLLSTGVHSTAAFAFPIAEPGTEGLEVTVSNTGPVVATYQGNSAVYSNDLYLMLDGSGKPGDDNNPANDRFIFNNHSSPVGSSVDLGSFPVGTKLIFRLHVNNTGNDYFTGPASRNPDKQAHTRAQANWMSNETLVSFEDLFNGPFNYNDLSFSFVPTTAISPLAGWHSNDGAYSLMFESIANESGLRILLGNMYVYDSPVADPLYWYVQVIYVNVSTKEPRTISCAGRTDPSLVKEHMQGTANSGSVAADETFCSRNPSFSGTVEPGGTHYEWAIFHNVPWDEEASQVRIEWDPSTISGWFKPWDRPYPENVKEVSPPAECPPELEHFGCKQDLRRQPMKVHLSRTPEGKAPNVVVLVHGCCTNYDAYLTEWYKARADTLISAIARNNAKKKAKATAWEIVVRDWSNFTPRLEDKPFEDVFKLAYEAAPGQGDLLAELIGKNPYYKYAHLIAHSAGARLIDETATVVKKATNKPFIHKHSWMRTLHLEYNMVNRPIMQSTTLTEALFLTLIRI